MFETPGSDSIWKIGNAIFHKRAILYLHETSGFIPLEKEVDSGVSAVYYLTPHPFITSKGPDLFADDRFLYEQVGNPRVDAHKGGGHLDHLPSVL